MSAALNKFGSIIGGVCSFYTALCLQMGLGGLIVINAVVLPIAVMSIGAIFASSDAPKEAPTAGVYVLQCILLALLFLSLWFSRVQHKRSRLIATAVYVLAGVAFIAVEARTSASLGIGYWPTWSGSGIWDVLVFVKSLWCSTGWLMMIWFWSAVSIVGCVLTDATEPTRTPVRPADVEPGDRAGASDLVVRPTLKLDALAGMADVKAQLRGFGENFRDYRRSKTQPSEINGLLLSGPPGNGKTVFAEALAGELGFSFLPLGVKDLASKWVNETPSRIAEAFAAAVANAPCVLFLDEIDAIGRDRGGKAVSGQGEDIKAVNALLQEIDRVRRQRVVVVAATNFADQLDAALVRPGRFDVKIEIPLPDLNARKGILSGLLRKVGLSATDDAVEAVAKLWERRSAAFIASMVKRLGADAKRVGGRAVTLEDLKAAGRAAARREGAIPKTGTPLSRLVLPASTAREAQSLVYRLKHWEKLAERGGTPPSGVLLYGPPGTGKTNLVRAIALELGDWHLFDVKVAEMLADPRTFEKLLAQATEHRPAIVFLDEADDLLRDRSYSANATATNEILKAMDGVMGGVPEIVFMAATNSPDAIDAAAKRGGRFTEKIFMDLLSGEDLQTFATSEMARRTAVRFAPDVTPQWLATLGPIGPADLVAVISKAINATLTDDQPAPVSRAAVRDAFTSILERTPVEA